MPEVTSRMRKPAFLLSSCALAGLAIALVQPARAQSFNGTGEVVLGSAVITTTPGQTFIEVGASETVIDWTAADFLATGNIDFQSVGTTATFSNGVSLPSYTVLNRITPLDGNGGPATSTVTFNGTVQSFQDNAIGGNVWFYSPYGVIAGPTAVFNTGSLLLTTSAINTGSATTGGTNLFGPAGEIQFRSVAAPGSFIEIQPGAQLTSASSAALVAPRIQMDGRVSADGPIAYVAAETLDLRVNGGLFDITVLTGTTDANGITHTGTTTGPASTLATDVQRIAMVAMPVSQALTMLLSGSIGYTPAAVAIQEGSSVVLSAGFPTAVPTDVPAVLTGSIAIGAAVFSNELTAFAANAITVDPGAGLTQFSANATLNALQSVSLTANGAAIDALADLTINSGAPGDGGSVIVQADGIGGRVSTVGNFIINANSDAQAFAPQPLGDASGGSISIFANTGGEISGVSLYATATGSGGFEESIAPSGSGGSVDLGVTQGGRISFGFTSLEANGNGGSSLSAGGTGTGGAVNIEFSNGILDLGVVSLAANGTGGSAPGQGGDGVGGKILMALDSGTHTWTLLDAQALARGGGGGGASSGGLAGNATGALDAITLNLTGTAVLQIDSFAFLGADSYVGTDGPAGYGGEAGGIAVNVATGTRLTVANQLQARADARIDGDFSSADPAITPIQQGGSVVITANGGRIEADELILQANAYGRGATSDAGAATGGNVRLVAQAGGIIATGDVLGTITLTANGIGGAGVLAGSATGGDASVLVDGGSITATGAVTVVADGLALEPSAFTSGPIIEPGNGPDTNGGLANITIAAAGSLLQAGGPLTIGARGDSSTNEPLFGFSGDGGVGTGGDASLTIAAGTLDTAGLLIDGSGRGGNAGESFAFADFGLQSGVGAGGSASFDQTGGTVQTGAVIVRAFGLGGDMSTATASANTQASLGGAGAGGTASLSATGGTFNASSLLVQGQGIGGGGMAGDGSLSGGAGGDATGGTATLTLGGTLAVTMPGTLQALATATGGNGGASLAGAGNGGNGSGGSASVNLASIPFSFGATSVGSGGTGGDGNTAGNGTGGTASLQLVDAGGGPFAPRQLASLDMDASGRTGTPSGPTTIPTQNAGSVTLSTSTAANSGLTIVGSMALSALGTTTPAAGNGITVSTSGAPLTINGALAQLLTSRNIALSAGAGAGIAAANAFTATGRAVTGTGNIGAGTTATITAPQGITLARLATGGSATLDSSAGTINVDELLSGGPATVTGSQVELDSTGALTFATLAASNGSLTVRTAGNMVLPGANATGPITLASSGGTISGTSVTGGGAVSINGAAGITLGQAAAGAAFAATTGGLFDVSGTVQGSSVAVTSADIAIGANGQIGTRGTTGTITLTNANGNTAMNLGGAAGGTTAIGYTLDGAELQRIFADSAITITNGTGLVTIRDLALTYGAQGNIGTGGALKVLATGVVRVTGTVALATASVDDLFSIDPTLIEVQLDTASIAMTGAGGAAQGTLELVGGTLAIADTNTLGAIGSASGTAAISDLLDNPAPAAGGDPVLTAGTIVLDATDALYIQNSGSGTDFADRRGFVAQDIFITTAGPNTAIAINGQMLAGGAMINGLDVTPLVTINDVPAGRGGQFDAASTINGCVIGANCNVPSLEELGYRPADTGPELDARLPDGEGGLPQLPQIEIIEQEPLIALPLVDEPITGVGNDDLWNSNCADDEDICE